MVDGRQRGPGRAIFREGAVRATRVVDGASGLAGPRGRGVTVAAGRPRAGARDRRVHGSGGCRRLPPTVGRETQPTSWGIRQHHPAPNHPWHGNAALQRRKVSPTYLVFRSRLPKSDAFDLSAQYEMIALSRWSPRTGPPNTAFHLTQVNAIVRRTTHRPVVAS